MATQQSLSLSSGAPLSELLRVGAVLLLGLAVMGAAIERFSFDRDLGLMLGLVLAAAVPAYFCLDYLRAQRRRSDES
ncbi:hypothetical protein [Chitinimonas lacunae]|uniref:DUF2892 domain-containing protein n=1 Tax=Chitinimonas lacunae TaxID=1963018 RepID=A0ABV8MTW8_9NEIS